MKLALIPAHAVDAPAVAATVAYSPEQCWVISESGRPIDALGASITSVHTSTEHPLLLAERLVPHLEAFAQIYLPMCTTGRELGAALSVALQRPLIGPVLKQDDQRTTLIQNERCVEVPTPSHAVYLVAAQPVGPPLAQVTEHHELALDRKGADDGAHDVRTTAVHPPDPAHIDLAEADRIVAAGIGCARSEVVEELREVGLAMGASLGATRVITDAGWLPFERQIGTTGVLVSPSLYLAFGISGAVQHLTGIGRPDHVISVNVDPGAPMMKFADLAICADAPATIAALAARLRDPDSAEPKAESGAIT